MDPAATVAVFPSDHFVLEEGTFMDQVREVSDFVGRCPQWIVLLGAQPTRPETEYGWIEVGEPLDATPSARLYRVRRFWEKPSAGTARACLAAGCLWNTLVVVAKAGTLVEAGRLCLPRLHERLARIAPFANTEDEAWAIQQAYALAPTANFSRGILEAGLPFLGVWKLPAVTWSDWGTPRRVVQSLRRMGIMPAWLSEMGRPA
jgi:mannose-1-phosphate guanylyltransferase